MCRRRRERGRPVDGDLADVHVVLGRPCARRKRVARRPLRGGGAGRRALVVNFLCGGAGAARRARRCDRRPEPAARAGRAACAGAAARDAHSSVGSERLK